ncbi:SDR family oxidoreductase [Yoonia sediminilitoris]|uniref:NADP-dependent 3-hydroxy acid dehydrogenase YdfG n=1 Tax=Yoonia sediminilitoris TaxID=1286148 RepID=A0A2T6KA25_9RHOB|nr:SDR family oxidoreductase [Yoonia sediminilitoris]PUB11593.1 NADP-dependent 3-hydroxy acid dehydrogenase YdfG [Yoonia sediminilitoris]RCW91793.1 NADP-dependent 3-hydroxy acid dehydrogenase YdfG [Yoonia sediminilitoris]
MDMVGKTVLITGASRGIGEATARVFAAAGANVALVARSTDAIASIAGDIGDKALAIPCDVSRYSDVAQAVAATAQTFGGLDILINNAGVVDPIGHLQDIDPDAWGRTIDINLKGVMHGMRAVVPGMVAQGHGTIINISSGAAHGPVEGWTAYCASKAGVYMLTRNADLELRDKGVRILGLSPGTVATEMQREIKASGVNPVSQLDWSVHIPPEWPARALLWMCTEQADAHLGTDISLREDDIRKQVGLI